VESSSNFGRLLANSLVALLMCAAIVVVCYRWIDRPVAYFVHDRDVPSHPALKWLTYPPPILQDWSPFVLTALIVRRVWGPFRLGERALLAACVGLILADQFRESLSYAFGRYWPDTWIDDNPSLIRDGAYGFHPFHIGSAYGSFPSGHMARTTAVAAAVWTSLPKLRWLCLAACLAVAVGLVGMNYHFVGDVVAGAFVGGFVGTYTAAFVGFGNSEPKEKTSRTDRDRS
jgi:membrane-associated phospholipid phosphatase